MNVKFNIICASKEERTFEARKGETNRESRWHDARETHLPSFEERCVARHENLCDIVAVRALLLAGASNDIDESAVVLNAALGTAGLVLLLVLLGDLRRLAAHLACTDRV